VSAAQKDNERRGGKGIDFSLLTDGLKAEREQGITIDVAYRYFNTDRRKFIIADSPGHEQYTRNMVTAASTADLALILVDARQGLVTQSRRHAFIAHLLGIRHIVVAVNKMDLVGFDRERYEAVCDQFRDFFGRLESVDLSAVASAKVDVRFAPISALQGDMVVERGANLPWYAGPTIMETLETIEIERQDASHFRFPIQLVNRPPLPELADFRGYMGRIASGHVEVGQPVVIMPAGRVTEVTGITTFDGERQSASAPQSVTLTLAEDVDISRGDMLVDVEDAPDPRRELDATICWMNPKPLRSGGRYRLRHTTRLVKAIVSDIRYRIDPNTIERQAGLTELHQNDIARVTIKTLQPIACDTYRENRETGSFLLIDDANDTAGAGFIEGDASA
jgi:sulfate adenylyltransferase subunit 1